MSDLCSRIVAWNEKGWAVLGWLLFATLVLAPYFITGTVFVFVGFGILGIVLLLWWLIDAIDQQVEWWQFLLAVIMLGIGFLPYGRILTLAAWILYWTKVRE